MARCRILWRCSTPKHMPTPRDRRRVIVVGAGVIGSSIAYHAATSGLAVKLFDGQLPASGATRHSFGWIRQSAGANGPSAELTKLIHEDFNRLQRDVPAVSIDWCGALVWGDHFGAGNDVSGSDIAGIEPRLRQTPRGAQLDSGDGAVDPVQLTEGLVEAARGHGAEVVLGQRVDELVMEDGTVVGVRAGEQVHTAATVVVAAGVDSPTICARAGIAVPARSSPAIMVRLKAEPGLISHIIANDDFEVRQLRDGTLLMPIDYEGQTSQRALEAAAEHTRRRLLRSLTVNGAVELLRVDVGWRPIPVGGQPIVGPIETVPGLYVCVVHPGIALAPTVGRLVAEELSTGIASDTLRQLRLSPLADDD